MWFVLFAIIGFVAVELSLRGYDRVREARSRVVRCVVPVVRTLLAGAILAAFVYLGYGLYLLVFPREGVPYLDQATSFKATGLSFGVCAATAKFVFYTLRGAGASDLKPDA